MDKKVLLEHVNKLNKALNNYFKVLDWVCNGDPYEYECPISSNELDDFEKELSESFSSIDEIKKFILESNNSKL